MADIKIPLTADDIKRGHVLLRAVSTGVDTDTGEAGYPSHVHAERAFLLALSRVSPDRVSALSAHQILDCPGFRILAGRVLDRAPVDVTVAAMGEWLEGVYVRSVPSAGGRALRIQWDKLQRIRRWWVSVEN
jgi:hypothetical protein